jgi:hypothetical protein
MDDRATEDTGKTLSKQNKIIIVNILWKMVNNLGISLKFNYVAKQ